MVPADPLDLRRLDTTRWRRIEHVLDEALDLPATERGAFVTAACGEDGLLRAQVEALLRTDAVTGSLLDEPAAALAAALEPPEDESAAMPAGTRVGPWRLVREIGRGGMGAVWLAERADGGFEQRAAIKLIKRGLDTDEILARFRRERQILARLQHPNIARLLDGGATAEGAPYFAMEYVDGSPLTQACDRDGLPLDAVLRRFLDACRAVEYAHRSLVVHRDLKPANILVSGSGEVKLLDFGIAQLLDPGGATATVTVAPTRRLTPDYAAPEQLRGEPATTATDVYALGVVLYELLAGVRPRAAGASAAPASVPPPSSRCVGSADARRAAWAGRVRGDLDRIVLMALREEPEARYPSVEALREDLERLRDGRPVRATRRTWRYRAWRYLRRHRAGVGVAGAALTALAVGLAATLWQARIAARERDRAVVEARKAGEVKDFVLGLFSASDPSQSRGADVTARDLLERGAARVERDLAGQPAVRAEMNQLLANVYWSLGEYGRADSLAARAVAEARRELGPRSPQLAQGLHWLGIIRRDRGQHREAIAILREALAMRRPLRGEPGRDYSATLGELASAYRQDGRLDSAEACYRRSLAIDRRLLGEEHPDVATDLDNLGVLLFDLGRYADAVASYRRALEIELRALGPDSPTVATTVTNLGLALADLGRFTEAESCYVQATRLRLRVLGPDHPDLAHSYSTYANLLRERGEFDRAIPLYERSLEIERRALGAQHPDVGRDVNNLAILYFERADFAAALAGFREALASRRRLMPADDRGCLTMENNVGVALRRLGRYAEAERILRDVRERRRRALGAGHPDVASSDHQLGVLLHLTGHDVEAERRLRAALAMRSAAGDSSQATGQTAEALATLLRDTGRLRESLALYSRAAAIAARLFDPPGPQNADAWVGYGRALLASGRAGEAERPLRQALALRARLLRPHDERVAEARAALGLCVGALGRTREADSLLAASEPVLAAAPGRPDRLLAQARAWDHRGRLSP